MLKKLIVCSALTALTLGSNVASASDTSVSVGVKTWINSWKQTDTSGGTTDTIESDKAIPMVGPTINIRTGGNLFFGASYLASTSDYGFTVDETFTDPDIGDVTTKGLITADRQDLDLIAGMMFTPRFGGFIGYKSINSSQKADITITTSLSPPFDVIEITGDSKDTLRGPGFGIMGNIPLGESPAVLYGSLAVMFLKDETTFSDGSPSESADVSGASIELGVAFTINPQISANVGIKVQSFSGDGEDPDTGVKSGTVETEFSGLTAGINYNF